MKIGNIGISVPSSVLTYPPDEAIATAVAGLSSATISNLVAEIRSRPSGDNSTATVGRRRDRRRSCIADYGNGQTPACRLPEALSDRKSTRLNSSHMSTSYAVFCLKKKNKNH